MNAFYAAHSSKLMTTYAKSFQSRVTLGDPMDCSPPGSSVHGFLQARILEWVAVPSSRGSSWSRDRTRISYVSCIGRWILLPLAPPGLPLWLSWWRIRLQCGRPGFCPWVGKILWKRERLPTPVFWPGEFRALYSPWDHKESDMTERLSLSTWE